MTTKASEHWISFIGPRLAQWGASWESVSRNCEQVVLFGSRAGGVSSDDSDFDLLCIGSGTSRLSRALDIVFIAPQDKLGERWLGSELGGHVARYGIWLKGEPDWVHRVHGSRHALERKIEKIIHRLQAVEDHFHLLDPSYLQKYFVLARRDLQRFEFLANSEPVPPTPILDRAWERLDDPWTHLRRLAREARMDSAFLLDRLSMPERWHTAPFPRRIHHIE